MRNLHICEELGTDWDKIVISCELFQLPAPKIDILNNHTRITFFANIPYTNLPWKINYGRVIYMLVLSIFKVNVFQTKHCVKDLACLKHRLPVYRDY